MAGAGHMGYANPSAQGITLGADDFGRSASGGMTGIAYNVADRNPRNSGMDAMHGSSLPPPPSHAQYPQSHQPHQQPHGAYGYDPSYNHGVNSGPSQSSLAGLAAGAGPAGMNTSDSFIDNPYQAYSSRNQSTNLGFVNPNEIADDGDDGLNYHRSQRNSMLSLPHSDRGRKTAITTAAAVGGGAAAGGLLGGRGKDLRCM